MSGIEFLDLGPTRRLAYRFRPGKAPTIMFMPGFRSDMDGSKASLLWHWAQQHGQACLLFDYRGHGQSSGDFEDGTIGDWSADAIAMLDHWIDQSAILVGSSMGGWIMLLTALARPSKVAGLIGIAAAPDFTERLMQPSFTEAQWQEMAKTGKIMLPSAYGDPTPVTRALLEDGARHLVMERPIDLDCPVYLLHGQDDPDVPWQCAIDLGANLKSQGVTIELIKDGDHRLSRESDLKRLEQLVTRMIEHA